MYNYDSNLILVETLKNRSATAIAEAWKALHNKLKKNGHKTSMFFLDNKFSGELHNALNKQNLQFQLIPPHAHRRNASESAIQTFKKHFLSVLATCDAEFTIVDWDCLLPQAETTLNMLCPAW